ncbi:hypothetical protein N234_33715 [Ralstonia pickettii DTP0602]|nr:hypothetical protein N234_33715 [Ralstonia pickettii DTP0602]
MSTDADRGRGAVTPATPATPATIKRFEPAKAIVGAGLLLLALVVFIDASQLPPPPAAGVGPSAGMRFVAVLLAVLGVGHLVVAVRRGTAEATAPRGPMNWKAVGCVLAGLLALIAALQLQLGFVLGATVLFIATARGFGERRMLRSAAIGLVLNLLVYAFFAKALSLGLPGGPLERLVFG